MAKVSKRRGRYVLDFYDNKGKRQRQTLKEGTTLKDAKGKLREIEDKLRNRTYIPEKKIPLFSLVAKDWLNQKKMNVRLSTWDMYEGHVRLHLDDFKDMKVNRITTAKAEKFIIQKRSAGMNLTTLKKVIVTFNQIMKYAVRHGYIDYNSVRDAERPKKQGQMTESDIQVLTPSQIKVLLDATINLKYKTLFMLAAMAGARQGEILGAKWSDIDWNTCQIHIQRTFTKGAWYEPKTKASNRKIDIGPKMIAELKKWKIACPPNDLNLIFPNKAGKPMNADNLRNRHFCPALKNAGLHRIRFHDLRHTYASLLIEQGENLKYIQSQLGHADPTVTLKVYAHLMKPVNPQSARKLEDVVFNRSQNGHK